MAPSLIVHTAVSVKQVSSPARAIRRHAWVDDDVPTYGRPLSMDVLDEDDPKPVLWVYVEGELTGLLRKRRIGF